MQYKIDGVKANQVAKELDDVVTYLNTSLEYVNRAIEKLNSDELDGISINTARSMFKILQMQHKSLLESGKDECECVSNLVSNITKFNEEGTIPQQWK